MTLKLFTLFLSYNHLRRDHINSKLKIHKTRFRTRIGGLFHAIFNPIHQPPRLVLFIGYRCKIEEKICGNPSKQPYFQLFVIQVKDSTSQQDLFFTMLVTILEVLKHSGNEGILSYYSPSLLNVTLFYIFLSHPNQPTLRKNSSIASIRVVLLGRIALTFPEILGCSQKVWVCFSAWEAGEISPQS